MRAKKIIYGVPIPLGYITPNLQFYPLILPENVVCISNNDKFNNANMDIKMTLKDQRYFIEKLMEMLNVNYIIIGNILIDLSRKDFEITIENKNVCISENSNKKVIYISEKYLMKLNNFTSINTKFKYKFPNNNDNDNIERENKSFIQYHCLRISLNTKDLQDKFLYRFNNLKIEK